MARYNHEEGRRIQLQRESYEKLKTNLKNLDDNLPLSHFFVARMHMEEMEIKITEQESEIKKYREFFATLKGFLPREFSMFDKIG
jgi:hypothetical protein